jgi:hypothetical protein
MNVYFCKFVKNKHKGKKKVQTRTRTSRTRPNSKTERIGLLPGLKIRIGVLLQLSLPYQSGEHGFLNNATARKGRQIPVARYLWPVNFGRIRELLKCNEMDSKLCIRTICDNS